MSNEYDVIVIGGGPAGYPAAIRAAQNKLKVACIDEWKNKDGTAVFGGTCTNAGCIPSKALLESSELYHKTKEELGVHGIKVGDVKFDIAQMQKRKTGIVKASTTGIAMLLKSAGVTALQGHGKLLAGRKVEFTAHDGKTETLLPSTSCSRVESIPMELRRMFDGRTSSTTGAHSISTRSEEARGRRCQRHRPPVGSVAAASRRRSRGAGSADTLAIADQGLAKSRASFQKQGLDISSGQVSGAKSTGVASNHADASGSRRSPSANSSSVSAAVRSRESVR
jgi:dihydrolipoamide dehydrogenase